MGALAQGCRVERGQDRRRAAEAVAGAQDAVHEDVRRDVVCAAVGRPRRQGERWADEPRP